MKTKKRITAKYVKAEVTRMFDIKGEPTWDEILGGCILMTAVVKETTDADKIAKFLKAPYSKVRHMVKVARKQKIFVGHKIYGSEWANKKDGTLSFILDSMCLSGLMSRA